jgi:putative ABC transport system permease protein
VSQKISWPRLPRCQAWARASALVQGTLATEWGDLAIFGVDLFADQQIRETQFPREHVEIKDALVFANSLDSIALSTSFAHRAALGPGATFDAIAPIGTTSLTIRGTLDPVGPAALFGGGVGLVDLPTAQRLFDREGRVDQIDIALAVSADRSAVADLLRARVAGAGTVEPPRDRGQRLASMVLGVQTILTLVSLFAVIVGAFILPWRFVLSR